MRLARLTRKLFLPNLDRIEELFSFLVLFVVAVVVVVVDVRATAFPIHECPRSSQ